MYKKLAVFVVKYGLVPLGHRMIRVYLSSVRREVINEEMIFRHLDNGSKAIAAIWHQRFFGVIGYASRFKGYAPSAIISKSRDGDLIAGLARRLNFRPLRGSSSRGGKEALTDLVNDLSVHPFAVHASAGPTGPKGILKPGLIRMSLRSGVPIVPVYISYSRAWFLQSWDRFMIPKPFSTVVIRWDDPVSVPDHLDSETFESTRRQVERHMRNNQEQDDLRWGRQGLLSA